MIASDIGLNRYDGEQENSFCLRVAYSAARFWLSAFCMDDGANGKEGISKQAMNRRLKGWVLELDAIHPGAREWFDADGNGISTVYGRLIDTGDIVLNGFKETYLAKYPSIVPISSDFSCITGFFDTTTNNGPCGYAPKLTVASGLLTLVHAQNGAVGRPEPWWDTDFDYMSWKRSSGYSDVRFADISTSRWNINRSDVWVEAPEWVDGLALARVDGNGVAPIVFVARQVRGGARLSRITWNQAQELFFFLRQKSGNGAVARYGMLDELHAQAKLPVGFVPGHINRFLDAVGWPVEDVRDKFNRIFRVEALPLVRELLAASSIGFEEISDAGQQGR